MSVRTAPGGDSPARGWILYDDTCGICRALAPRLTHRLRAVGIGAAPLQAPWVAARVHAGPGDIARDVLLLLADGTIIRGADVYRFALREGVATYPLYVLSLIPPVRQSFDFCYRLVARNRHRLSRLCGIPGAEVRPPSGGSV